MGFGILAHIKHLAPLSIYILMIVLFVMGLFGKGRWSLLLVIFLIPLRNVIEKIQELPLGTKIIDILIFSAMVSWFINTTMQKKKLFANTFLNYILILLIGYTLFSLLLGSNFLNGTFSLSLADDRVKDWKNFCLMPLLFFLTLNHITDRKWIERVLIVMALSMGLMEYYTTTQIAWYSSLASREKITGTFQFLGPNEVAAFFNQYTVMMVGMFFCVKQKRIRSILLAMIYVNIFCIIFIYSRAAYLGFFAGLILLFSFKNRAIIIPLVLVAIFWQVVLPEKAVQRIKGTKDEYGQLDESSKRRLLVWQQGIKLFENSPVIGTGYGVFRHLGLDLGDTHNIYVKILVEQGIVGVFLFLMILFCFLRMGYVLYKKGEEDLDKGMGLGLMACIATVAVNNFFGDRWTYLELSTYLWVFAGLVARLIIIDVKPETLKVHTQEARPNVSNPAPKTKKKKIRYYDL